MKLRFKMVSLLLLVLVIFSGCASEEKTKENARYIKHSEIVNNFDTYNGELVKVEGVVLLDEGYKEGDDFTLLNVINGEYSATIVTNTLGYKPYKGEYLTAYGKVNAVSKEPYFFEVKAVRVESEIIEQADNQPDELKNDPLIQEMAKLE